MAQVQDEAAVSGTTAASVSSIGASKASAAANVAQATGDALGESALNISDKSFLINLIDTPGRDGLSFEVTAALRVTDGAFIIVDCIEWVNVQIEAALRQAICEKVRPVLMLNKLDRCIFELLISPEDAYKAFVRTIESLNVIISTYHDTAVGDMLLDPIKGMVVFGSGLQQWGFTLQKFAKLYATKFSTTRHKMLRRLWGDMFYNKKGE
jgi:elongation factor 2